MDNKTAEVIQAIAEKLGVTAEYLWEVLLRQAFVKGVTSLVIVVLSVIGLWLCKKMWDQNADQDPFEFPIRVPIGIAGAICSGAMFASTMEAVNAFMNPEFWALNYIINKL